METTEFIELLKGIDRAEMDDVLERLEILTSTTADEISWWEDTLAIQRVLRRAGRTRVAARQAHVAASAVQAAAERLGLELPDERVTRLARASAEVVRGLVAGATVAESTRRLLSPWSGILTSPVAA